jgi:hypothetical protein
MKMPQKLRQKPGTGPVSGTTRTVFGLLMRPGAKFVDSQPVRSNG